MQDEQDSSDLIPHVEIQIIELGQVMHFAAMKIFIRNITERNPKRTVNRNARGNFKSL